MGIWDDIKKTFRHGTNLTRLIYINIAVFIFIAIVSVFSFLLKRPDISETFLNIFSVPASYMAFIQRPWSLVTYMFTHKDIWHILFNMLWLYWFGKIFLEYLDQRKLVAVYLLGGISGAVIYIVSFNIFPAFEEVIHGSVAIGASASVMAVVIAITAYIPEYIITLFLFGRIKIKYIALAIFVLTSIMDFSVNSGGKLAHFGGAAFGYVYAVNLTKGKDLGRVINRIIDFFVTLLKPEKKLKVTHKKPVSDYDYNRFRSETQARINIILDKISKGGYDSLTKEEKDTLFRESSGKN